MTRDTHGRGRRSELMMRVASSLALASVALVSAWFGGIVFALVWGVAALSVWREWLFVLMSRAARDAADYYRIPSNRVIEVGSQIEI